MPTRAARLAAMPPGLAPRGLSREEAATYIGVSPGKLDQMVADGRMPAPKRIDGRRVWDRLAPLPPWRQRQIERKRAERFNDSSRIM